jgi:uncharacterized protein
MSARIAWISRTPVKALKLEHLEEAELGEGGVEGDRRFYLVGETGALISNKHHPRLQLVAAACDDRTLTLRFPDGREVAGAIEHGEEITTRFHRWTRPARRIVGPWSDELSSFVDAPLTLVEAPQQGTDRGRNGAATLLATASLTAIAAQFGGEAVDGRRFRMNFGIDGLEPHEEDTWLRRKVRLGDAVVIPNGNVGRCVITKLNPETAVSDLDTLNALAAYRSDVETTEPLPFGVHASVATPGRVRVGDPVSLA